MFAVLDEAQRLQYLQAVGVTSWLPIKSLSVCQVNDVLWQDGLEPLDASLLKAANGLAEGAILPVSLDENLPPPLGQQQSASAQRVIEPHQQLVAVAETISLLTANDKSPERIQSTLGQFESLRPKSEVIPTKAALAASRDRFAPLHLGLSWYSNGVLVVNDIPVQEGAAMSSPIQRLQTAIVNALEPALVAVSRQVMPASAIEFNWPLVPGPHADHSLLGAQSGLAYSLIKLLKSHTCQTILVMGPVAMQLLKPDMSVGTRSNIKLSDQVIPSVYTHSLHQLLAVPSLKSETWQHIQPLLSLNKVV